MVMDSLWGDKFTVAEKNNTKKILSKIKKETTESPADTEKLLKSKKVPLEDKIKTITENVYKILGKQKDNVQLITTEKELHDYIQKGLMFGRIAIDTETNNSLDPLTCKLMGLCLYVKGEKQVYVPVNHVDLNTRELLPDQLTEQQIGKELQWMVDNKNSCKFIFHNYVFDYEVIKCTCGVMIPLDYDSIVAAQMIDENDRSGLKYLYTKFIDPSQEKYNIEHLFEGLEYAIFKPELFALYAATDAMMTDRLYEYQMEIFKKPGYAGVWDCTKNIEFPVEQAVAETELYGVAVDGEYAARLSAKYHKIAENVDQRLNVELTRIKPQIDAWKLTAEANQKPVKEGGKVGKSKAEQLSDPISITSPTQLSILFYDIFKVGVVDKDNPRGTGEEILNKIYAKTKNPLCKVILEKRGVEKLISTYVDKIPAALNPKDNRVHARFKQLGAKTGRFASDNPNLQNIPAHAKDIRMMFRASVKEKDVEVENSCYEVSAVSEVLTNNGWKRAGELRRGDVLENAQIVKNVEQRASHLIIHV